MELLANPVGANAQSRRCLVWLTHRDLGQHVRAPALHSDRKAHCQVQALVREQRRQREVVAVSCCRTVRGGIETLPDLVLLKPPARADERRATTWQAVEVVD